MPVSPSQALPEPLLLGVNQVSCDAFILQTMPYLDIDKDFPVPTTAHEALRRLPEVGYTGYWTGLLVRLGEAPRDSINNTLYSVYSCVQ